MNTSKKLWTYTLRNGLEVVIRPIAGSQVVVVNMMYHVGSKHEKQGKTGLAHLLEHVMCAGSTQIRNYDEVLQRAGAESNAFTSFDVTNYWSMLPKGHLETALWVESERMFFSNYAEQVIATQKKVVMEEFKQMALAKPYGNVWHHLLPAAYGTHPYGHPIIGERLDHIASLTKADIEEFAKKHYTPSHAALSIVGGVEPQAVLHLIEKWFDLLPTGRQMCQVLPQEPPQQQPKRLQVKAAVPQDALYMAYPMGGFCDATYSTTQVLASLLADGKSALLYHHLVEQEGLMSEVHAYTLDTWDPGLFMIEGKLQQGVALRKAEERLAALLGQVARGEISTAAVKKAAYQVESQHAFDEVHPTDQAENLAWSTLLGNPRLIEEQVAQVQKISPQEVQAVAQKLWGGHQGLVLDYIAAKNPKVTQSRLSPS